MQETLHCVLAVGSGTDSKVTLTLPDPKAGITLASCQTVFADVISKELISVNGVPVTRLDEAYIKRVEEVPLT